MVVYEGNMVRKGESRLSPIGGPGHGILLRWPSQEGGDLSPDIHCSPFNSTPLPSDFRLATVSAGPNEKRDLIRIKTFKWRQEGSQG